MTSRKQVVDALTAAAAVLASDDRTLPRGGNDRRAHEAAVMEFTKNLHAADFKKATAVAKKLGQVLGKMLPDGFKVTLPPPKEGALPSSFVSFKQFIAIDGKSVASVEARFNIKRTGDYFSERHALSDPEWTLNMWIPTQAHAYPTSIVSSGASVPGAPHIKKLLALPDNPVTADMLLTALGGPKAGKHAVVTMDAVKRFVMRHKGWLDLEEETPTALHLSTREHGEVGYDKPGREDKDLARELDKKLISEFGRDAIDVRWGTTDEWTSLHVELKKTV